MILHIGINSCTNAVLVPLSLRTSLTTIPRRLSQMALKLFVSYAATATARAAPPLGRLLASPGAELSLASVRHSQGGALEEKEAEELLARGATSVGAPDMPRHVVVNAGTSIGLAELAERE